MKINRFFSMVMLCAMSMSLSAMDDKRKSPCCDKFKKGAKGAVFVGAAMVPTAASTYGQGWPLSASIIALGGMHKLHKEVITNPAHRNATAGAAHVVAVECARAAWSVKGHNTPYLFGTLVSLATGFGYFQPKSVVPNSSHRVKVGVAGCLAGLGTMAGSFLSQRNDVLSQDTNRTLFMTGLLGFGASVKMLGSGFKEFSNLSAAHKNKQ